MIIGFENRDALRGLIIREREGDLLRARSVISKPRHTHVGGAVVDRLDHDVEFHIQDHERSVQLFRDDLRDVHIDAGKKLAVRVFPGRKFRVGRNDQILIPFRSGGSFRFDLSDIAQISALLCVVERFERDRFFRAVAVIIVQNPFRIRCGVEFGVIRFRADQLFNDPVDFVHKRIRFIVVDGIAVLFARQHDVHDLHALLFRARRERHRQRRDQKRGHDRRDKLFHKIYLSLLNLR